MADNAGSSANEIHVVFIPFLCRSRGLSMVGTALLLARRSGFRCTVVTTPGNSSYIRGSIERAKDSHGLPVDLELVPFPAAEAGLPPGVECTDALPPSHGSFLKLYRGMQLLQRPVEELVIDRLRPDIMVFDYLLFWFADVARSRSIPFFPAVCSPGSDTVGPLTALPHPLVFCRSEIQSGAVLPGLKERLGENDSGSCGVLLNSFEELTPGYVAHCGKMTAGSFGGASRLLCIGPLQLVDAAGSSWDGGALTVKEWLDSKPPESVVYVSFGSESFFGPEQLREIAAGLQGCGHPFVWVVRRNGGGAETMDEWIPPEFRTTVGDRGLILTEWAPQVAILNHPAAGAFVTHCGWRSTLEAVCAGLPVVPWPLHAEQFVNERLLVEVLGVGVRILEGPKMRTLDYEGKGLVKGGLIRDAVGRLMGGGDEEAKAMREAARRYKELARSAVAEGGSSYANMSGVIEHMKQLAKEKRGVF